MENLIDDTVNHQETHKQVHKLLDELVADFITHTGKLPSKTLLIDFMKWSYEQTLKAD